MREGKQKKTEEIINKFCKVNDQPQFRRRQRYKAKYDAECLTFIRNIVRNFFFFYLENIKVLNYGFKNVVLSKIWNLNLIFFLT